jgi:hypothetical protein
MKERWLYARKKRKRANQGGYIKREEAGKAAACAGRVRIGGGRTATERGRTEEGAKDEEEQTRKERQEGGAISSSTGRGGRRRGVQAFDWRTGM